MKPPDSSASPFPVANPAQSEIQPVFRSLPARPAQNPLQRVTPLAWQHINFYGRYRFDSDLRPINLAALAQNLAKTDSKKWGMVA